MQQLLEWFALAGHDLAHISTGDAHRRRTKRMTCINRPGSGLPLSIMTRILCIVWILRSSLPFSNALRSDCRSDDCSDESSWWTIVQHVAVEEVLISRLGWHRTNGRW